MIKLRTTYHAIAGVWQQNRRLKRYLRVLVFLLFIAILAPLIANDRPLICHYQGSWLFPAFSWKNQSATARGSIRYNMGKDWKYLNAEFIVFAPCSWSPNTLDTDNAPRKSPFDQQWMTQPDGSISGMPPAFRHWLGTTQNGQDVLSILIHGTTTALGISFASMLIATLLGMLLGSSAGYFGNDGLRIGPLQLVALLFGIFMTYFYCCVIRGDKLAEAFRDGGLWLALRLLFLCYIATKTIGGLVWLAGYTEKKIGWRLSFRFPLDSIVSKSIELFNSVPSLLLILCISAVAKPSYGLLIMLLGLLGWTDIARLARAEYMKAKHQEYVLAGKALGLKNRQIMFRHILPNMLPLVSVQVVFGMGSAVLAEASLSFLGIGVPPGAASWGSLLNEGRDHFTSWWLVVFPGACLCLLLLLYHNIARELASTRVKD